MRGTDHEPRVQLLLLEPPWLVDDRDRTRAGNGEATLAFLNGCQHGAFESGGGDASELEVKAGDSEEEDN